MTGSESYSTAYTYDKNNRLLTETKTVDSVDEVTTYTYDANGNTLTATTGSDVITYTYNCKNQQISWSDGTDTVTYTYNLSGLRASKTNTGVSVTVNYIWSGANMVYEYVTGFPATGIRHYYGLTLIYSSNGNFYLYNAHGDVVQLVDEDGEILRTYEYDAFGNEKDPDGADTNYFRYCGEYFDIESGTYYLRARYYNPANGRFTSEDPAQAGLNWYVYANSNPVLYIDPNGLDAYIYYLPEWEIEALADQKELMKQYNLAESQVHLIVLNEKSDLTTGWNAMGTDAAGNAVTIDAVIINTHASPNSLSGFGGIFGVSFSIKDISKLDNKDIGVLLIYGCNAGHTDYKDNNVAAAFAKKVNGAPVLASDGTVYSWQNPDGSYSYESRNDKTFIKFRNKVDKNSTRDNQGWVVYQYTNGRISVIPTKIVTIHPLANPTIGMA